MGKLRDLDKFDDVLEEHFSDDANIRKGLTNLILAQDPEWLRKTGENNRRKAQDPEFRAKLKEAKAKYNDDPEYRRKLREARAKYIGDPEYHAKLKAAQAIKSNDPSWIAKVTKNRKPVLTPYGAFGSINDAAKQLYEQNHLTTTSITPLASIKLRIKYLIKHYHNEWKFISIEEYIMLTGKKQ